MRSSIVFMCFAMLMSYGFVNSVNSESQPPPFPFQWPSSNPFFPTPTPPADSNSPPSLYVPPYENIQTCAGAAVYLGFCWSVSSRGSEFPTDIPTALGCCSVFRQMAQNCFGGREEIPNIISHYVSPAFIQFCETHH